MIKNNTNAPIAAPFYKDLLSEIKSRVRKAQNRLATVANTELLALYWDIGGLLVDRQKMEGWGAGVLRRLATDLKCELSDQQGYSERNLKLMTQFYREYPGLFAIGQQAVARFNGRPQIESGTRCLKRATACCRYLRIGSHTVLDRQYFAHTESQESGNPEMVYACLHRAGLGV
ncbi:MAG: hypothetical protein SRB2_03730 [Desulfobacteraceae bacterium Eth-SRB2]|nr:MAG: hypothetical protein SRB2_03730 [Desulfobacteraceae bacterium Eth-SRB2]